MLSSTIVHFFALAASSILASVMGADHRSGDLPRNDGWQPGVYAAVNQPNRVHGFWVNSTDVLFYRGGNDEINTMIEALSSVPKSKIDIVLHAGTGVAKSPWGSGPKENSTNWSVTTWGAFVDKDKITIDVWVGNGIDLAKLKIPDSISVKSGGEIESFIKNRASDKKNSPK